MYKSSAVITLLIAIGTFLFACSSEGERSAEVEIPSLVQKVPEVTSIPTPDIEATVQARLAEERSIDATVQARLEEERVRKAKSLITVTPIPPTPSSLAATATLVPPDPTRQVLLLDMHELPQAFPVLQILLSFVGVLNLK